MTADELASVTLEHLRAIRADVGDIKERMNRVEVRLSVMEQTLGSLYALAGGDRESLHSLTRRVERIERRLDLTDPAH
jgi:archaellum component FlaC